MSINYLIILGHFSVYLKRLQDVNELWKEEIIIMAEEVQVGPPEPKLTLTLWMKSDLSLNTWAQYVEYFKFWVLAAGNAHTFPENVIVKIFFSGLKPEVFCEEIYSRH